MSLLVSPLGGGGGQRSSLADPRTRQEFPYYNYRQSCNMVDSGAQVRSRVLYHSARVVYKCHLFINFPFILKIRFPVEKLYTYICTYFIRWITSSRGLFFSNRDISFLRDMNLDIFITKYWVIMHVIILNNALEMWIIKYTKYVIYCTMFFLILNAIEIKKLYFTISCDICYS